MRAELRSSMRSKRAALTLQQRVAAAFALREVLADFAPLAAAKIVVGYVAVGGELPLSEVTSLCQERAQRYCLPVLTDASNLLRFAPSSPSTPMAPNRFAILEPVVEQSELLDGSDLELVLVPMVAFDRRGNRLGSGGGFYDRTFDFLRAARRPGKPLLIGIGYAFQELDHIEPEPWDVQVDWIATDSELRECRT